MESTRLSANTPKSIIKLRLASSTKNKPNVKFGSVTKHSISRSRSSPPSNDTRSTTKSSSNCKVVKKLPFPSKVPCNIRRSISTPFLPAKVPSKLPVSGKSYTAGYSSEPKVKNNQGQLATSTIKNSYVSKIPVKNILRTPSSVPKRRSLSAPPLKNVRSPYHSKCFHDVNSPYLHRASAGTPKKSVNSLASSNLTSKPALKIGNTPKSLCKGINVNRTSSGIGTPLLNRSKRDSAISSIRSMNSKNFSKSLTELSSGSVRNKFDNSFSRRSRGVLTIGASTDFSKTNESSSCIQILNLESDNSILDSIKDEKQFLGRSSSFAAITSTPMPGKIQKKGSPLITSPSYVKKSSLETSLFPSVSVNKSKKSPINASLNMFSSGSERKSLRSRWNELNGDRSNDALTSIDPSAIKQLKSSPRKSSALSALSVKDISTPLFSSVECISDSMNQHLFSSHSHSAVKSPKFECKTKSPILFREIVALANNSFNKLTVKGFENGINSLLENLNNEKKILRSQSSNGVRMRRMSEPNIGCKYKNRSNLSVHKFEQFPKYNVSQTRSFTTPKHISRSKSVETPHKTPAVNKTPKKLNATGERNKIIVAKKLRSKSLENPPKNSPTLRMLRRKSLATFNKSPASTETIKKHNLEKGNKSKTPLSRKSKSLENRKKSPLKRASLNQKSNKTRRSMLRSKSVETLKKPSTTNKSPKNGTMNEKRKSLVKRRSNSVDTKKSPGVNNTLKKGSSVDKKKPRIALKHRSKSLDSLKKSPLKIASLNRKSMHRSKSVDTPRNSSITAKASKNNAKQQNKSSSQLKRRTKSLESLDKSSIKRISLNRKSNLSPHRHRSKSVGRPKSRTPQKIRNNSLESLKKSSLKKASSNRKSNQTPNTCKRKSSPHKKSSQKIKIDKTALKKGALKSRSKSVPPINTSSKTSSVFKYGSHSAEKLKKRKSSKYLKFSPIKKIKIGTPNKASSKCNSFIKSPKNLSTNYKRSPAKFLSGSVGKVPSAKKSDDVSEKKINLSDRKNKSNSSSPKDNFEKSIQQKTPVTNRRSKSLSKPKSEVKVKSRSQSVGRLDGSLDTSVKRMEQNKFSKSSRSPDSSRAFPSSRDSTGNIFNNWLPDESWPDSSDSRRRPSSPSKSRLSARNLTRVSLMSSNRSPSNSFVFPTFLSDESPTSLRKSPYTERLSDIKSPIVRNIKRKLDALSHKEAESAAIQLKEEPPKSLDKKKVAALIKCHGAKVSSSPDTSSLESSQLKANSERKARSCSNIASPRRSSLTPRYSQLDIKNDLDISGDTRAASGSVSSDTLNISGIAELMATPLRDSDSSGSGTYSKFGRTDDGHNEGILKAVSLTRKSDILPVSRQEGPRRSRRLHSSHRPPVYRKTPAKIALSRTKLTEISMSICSTGASASKKNVSFRRSLEKSPHDAESIGRGVKRKSGDGDSAPPATLKSILKRARKESPNKVPHSFPIENTDISSGAADFINITSTPLPKAKLRSTPARKLKVETPSSFHPEVSVAGSPIYSSPAYSEIMLNSSYDSSEGDMRTGKSVFSDYKPDGSVTTMESLPSTLMSVSVASPDTSGFPFDLHSETYNKNSFKRRLSRSLRNSQPDINLTSFDFMSLKTPDITRDVFVSTLKSSDSSLEDRYSDVRGIVIPSVTITSPTPPKKSFASCGKKKMFKSSKITTPDYSDVRGVRKMFKTPNSKETNSPACSYSDIRGVKRMFSSPPAKGSSPIPDYSDVVGVKKMFASPFKGRQSPVPDYSNVDGIHELFLSPKKLRESSRSPTVSSVKKLFDDSSVDFEVARKLFLDGNSSGNVSTFKHLTESPPSLKGSRKRKPAKIYDFMKKPSDVGTIMTEGTPDTKNSSVVKICGNINGLENTRIESDGTKSYAESSFINLRGQPSVTNVSVDLGVSLKRKTRGARNLTANTEITFVSDEIEENELLNLKNSKGTCPDSGVSQNKNNFTKEKNPSPKQNKSVGNVHNIEEESLTSSKRQTRGFKNAVEEIESPLSKKRTRGAKSALEESNSAASKKQTRGAKNAVKEIDSIDSARLTRGAKRTVEERIPPVSKKQTRFAKNLVEEIDSTDSTRRTRGAKRTVEESDSVVSKKETRGAKNAVKEIDSAHSTRRTRGAKNAVEEIIQGTKNAVEEIDLAVSISQTRGRKTAVKDIDSTNNTRQTRGAKDAVEESNSAVSKKQTRGTKNAVEEIDSTGNTRQTRGAKNAVEDSSSAVSKKQTRGAKNAMKDSNSAKKPTRGIKDVVEGMDSAGSTRQTRGAKNAMKDSNSAKKQTRGAKNAVEDSSSAVSKKQTRGAKNAVEDSSSAVIKKQTRGAKNAVEDSSSAVNKKQIRGAKNAVEDSSSAVSKKQTRGAKNAMKDSNSAKKPTRGIKDVVEGMDSAGSTRQTRGAKNAPEDSNSAVSNKQSKGTKDAVGKNYSTDSPRRTCAVKNAVEGTDTALSKKQNRGRKNAVKQTDSRRSSPAFKMRNSLGKTRAKNKNVLKPSTKTELKSKKPKVPSRKKKSLAETSSKELKRKNKTRTGKVMSKKSLSKNR